MTCECKLPIIRGYGPDCYCLRCGLKLKNKTMRKKIKDAIQLKAGYKYLNEWGNFETTVDNYILKRGDYLWVTKLTPSIRFSETTIRENPELFEDVYEENERKKICVEIEYDYLETRFGNLDLFQVRNCLENTNCYINDRNIKVTEIKPVTKEDVEWFYNAGWRRPCNNFNSLWAEFQAKKEAEKNG